MAIYKIRNLSKKRHRFIIGKQIITLGFLEEKEFDSSHKNKNRQNHCEKFLNMIKNSKDFEGVIEVTELEKEKELSISDNFLNEMKDLQIDNLVQKVKESKHYDIILKKLQK